jgi:4-alpha-glucanotransferase
VLSTCPYPLLRVMQRFGFGRFRVTQKANPLDPNDVYRTDLAVKGDWVMLGNHDTNPIWRTVEGWPDAKIDAWSRYLSPRLARTSVDRAALPQMMLADLFACDAGHVGIFFADLLGIREVYNRPGVVDADNWTLRAGNDFAAKHATRVASGEALDVIAAMSTALRARGNGDLANALDALDALGYA